MAQDEMARIDSETLGATIRADVATKEKAAQDTAVANAQNVDAFLHTKFTDEELYHWMVAEISTTYFQAYQLAYSIAKAPSAASTASSGSTTPATSSSATGTACARASSPARACTTTCAAWRPRTDPERARARDPQARLARSLDPYALVELRENGNVHDQPPELLFDLDNPGHYMRRLKSVA